MVVGNKFDPVPIGIERKRNILHATIGKSLMPLDAQSLESLAGFLDIWDRDRDMTEAASGLTISGCISVEIGITLRTVIMRKFQNTCRSKS